MNRTHIASAANPNSAAPIPATASMVSGAVKRVPTRAPTHNPAYEAPQASSGVTSQPNTMRRCANQRGTAPPAPRRPYRLRASATTASAASAMVKPAPAGGPGQGVCLERPQQHDVEDGEHDRAPQPDRGGPRDTFDVACLSEAGGEETHGKARREHHQRLEHALRHHRRHLARHEQK